MDRPNALQREIPDQLSVLAQSLDSFSLKNLHKALDEHAYEFLDVDALLLRDQVEWLVNQRR